MKDIGEQTLDPVKQVVWKELKENMKKLPSKKGKSELLFLMAYYSRVFPHTIYKFVAT